MKTIKLVDYGRISLYDAKELADSLGLSLVKGPVSGDYYLE